MLISWTNLALDELADIYVSVTAEHRLELVAAVKEIETELKEHGKYTGESRGEFQRVYFHPLLVVMYTHYQKLPLQIVSVRPNRPDLRS